jgi:four helix bundle protein
LRAHQLASAIVVDAIRLARSFRGAGSVARADQLVRATLSVCSNIAEACGRGTVPDFRRFLLYARGSAHEALSQLRIARELEPARGAEFRRLESRTALLLKMIGRLIENPPPDR